MTRLVMMMRTLSCSSLIVCKACNVYTHLHLVRLVSSSEWIEGKERERERRGKDEGKT